MTDDKKEGRAVGDRNLLFAQRYGYQPLPDVANHKLCQEFRNELGRLITFNFYRRHQDIEYKFWEYFSSIFQISILKKSFDQVQQGEPKKLESLIATLIVKGQFYDILSFVELILRQRNLPRYMVNAIHYAFNQKLAPYAISVSTESICIIPLDMPESADMVVQCFEDVHKSGVTSAHGHLRGAAGHINAQQYSDAIADSVHAVEAIARDMTDGTKTLGPALDELKNQGLIDPALKAGIKKLYGYASNTPARHGQPSDKAAAITQTRDEALLIFSTCAAIIGFLARKKLEMDEKV